MIRKAFITLFAIVAMVFTLAGVTAVTFRPFGPSQRSIFSFQLSDHREVEVRLFSNHILALLEYERVDARPSLQPISFHLRTPTIGFERLYFDGKGATLLGPFWLHTFWASPTSLFIIAGVFGLFPALTFLRGPLHRRRRRRCGLCVKCGYNLTGNTTGVCPECGTKIEARRTCSPRRGGRSEVQTSGESCFAKQSSSY